MANSGGNPEISKKERSMHSLKREIFRLVAGMAVVIFLLAQTCAAMAQQQSQTQPSAQIALPRMVVAHWIVPMKYTETQTGLQPLMDDVRAAKEMGLDGFALNMFSGQQARGVFKNFIAAADAVGAANFKFFLSADMSLKFKPEEIVQIVREFGSNPHYLRVNGKPLLSTYGGTGAGNDWWETNVLAPLRNSGDQVTFVPYFDRPNPNGDPPNYDNWIKVIQRFPSIDGLFNFFMAGSTPFYSTDPNIGHHWWSILEAEENLARALKDSRKFFMAPFSPYYWAVCHPARQYLEYQGGRGMDNFWRSIIEKQQPDIVQIVTWNDYSESTFVQPTRIPYTKTKGIPSYPHLGYYELMKYYISWYKTGRPPTIAKDAMFAFFRTHAKDAAPQDNGLYCPLGPTSESQKWGVMKDVIYLTTALTAPAEIKVTAKGDTTTYSVPSGVNTTDIPFVPGAQTVKLVRNGNVVISISDIAIDPAPKTYNFNLKSEFVSAGGTKSGDWLPNDDWKRGFIADWFSP